MPATLARIAVWLLLAISLVLIGWDEPLRYKIMSKEQIAAEEEIYRPKPKKKPEYRDFKPSSSLLNATPPPRRQSNPQGLQIGR